MRIYEEPAPDFEEKLQLDRRLPRPARDARGPARGGARRLHLQGLAVEGEKGTWSESAGHQVKETLTFLDDDIARFMEEALARAGTPTGAAADCRCGLL